MTQEKRKTQMFKCASSAQLMHRICEPRPTMLKQSIPEQGELDRRSGEGDAMDEENGDHQLRSSDITVVSVSSLRSDNRRGEWIKTSHHS